jgi:acetyl-CoA synthetase (ADP-forming)
MDRSAQIIKKASNEGRCRLSEYESKKFLADFGVPVPREKLITSEEELIDAAAAIGYPVVLKAGSADIAHKTETDSVRLDIRNNDQVLAAYADIVQHMQGAEKSVLLQQMIRGRRELMMGLSRDRQFGPCVMFGLGGIFAEILSDTTFRIAPLQKTDALEMLEEINAHRILRSVRGLKAVDRDLLAEMLVTMGRIGINYDEIWEIDINPIIISGGRPVAVDALVVLQKIGV